MLCYVSSEWIFVLFLFGCLVRSLPDEKYLCSLCDEETSLIVAMAASCSQDGGITMVTGGMQLKIWKQLTNEKDQR